MYEIDPSRPRLTPASKKLVVAATLTLSDEPFTLKRRLTLVIL
ncbi:MULTISPECIES: hypothetical protein [Cyanophyceae]|nr:MULTISPECIES: hypothetical protein [unclassified Trichocoleus]